MDECEVSFGEFIEAGKGPSEMLEIAEHDFDFVALFVEVPVSLALD